MTDTADRVAELVTAAREGRAEASAPTPPRVRAVDWRRPTKFTPEHERRTKRLHDTFCQSAAVRLGSELRVPLDLELINISQLTWSAAHAELGAGSVCAVLETAPLGTPLLLSLELPLALFGIERLLGGGAGINTPPRRLTEIDWMLARRLFGMISDQLSGTWEDLAGLTLAMRALDGHAACTHVAIPSDPTLVLTFEVRIAQSSGTMTLLVPHASVKTVADHIAGGDPTQREDTEEHPSGIRRAIGGVEVELRAEAGAISVPIETILNLAPGDVVRLGSAAAGVCLYAGDQLVGHARPGRSRGHRAVQLEGRAS